MGCIKGKVGKVIGKEKGKNWRYLKEKIKVSRRERRWKWRQDKSITDVGTGGMREE